MDDQLFKKYYNKDLGVSFFYDSQLSNEAKSDKQVFDNGLCLKYDNFQFKLLKLSPEANIGLRFYGLENGLRSSLDNTEIVIEDNKPDRIKIVGSKIVQTTTIVPKDGGNMKIKRYLVSQDGQGYLLAFQDKAELFDSSKTQSMIENIIDTIKLLNS